MWLNIGQCWILPRLIPVLVSHPKQVLHSPKRFFFYCDWLCLRRFYSTWTHLKCIGSIKSDNVRSFPLVKRPPVEVSPFPRNNTHLPWGEVHSGSWLFYHNNLKRLLIHFHPRAASCVTACNKGRHKEIHFTRIQTDVPGAVIFYDPRNYFQ